MKTLRVSAALLTTALAAGQGAAALPARAVQHVAVVSFAPGTGSVALRASGVAVVTRHHSLDAAVVRGTDDQLRTLASAAEVRGVVPDADLAPSGHSEHGDGDSVFAWEGVGGRAGRAGSGAGVTVAVVDSGISDSPALSRAGGRLSDGVDTSGDGTFTDGFGHGTFMANVVAGGPVPGSGQRGLGVAPAASVVNVKVAGADGSTSLSKVVAGLDWVVAHRASRSIDIVSFSFSRTRPGPGYGADPLTDAVERVRDAGITVVVSAGNVPGEVGDPGFSPRMLTVGAADLRNSARVAPFSGSATVAGVLKPDVVASGVGVLSTVPADSVIATSYPEARRSEVLWRGSGTSQATAVVAGTAALFLQRHPDATPTQVKASLRRAATPLRPLAAGAGLLRLPRRLVDGTEPGNDGYGGSGEGGFDANSWGANSWGANSWGANSWGANSWGANSWGANSWGVPVLGGNE